MTEKELKKLKRVELLEMLVEQMEENQRLKERVHNQDLELQNRMIAIDRAGSIAEASLELNGVFAAADEAVKQYLQNVQELRDKQEIICKEEIEAAKKEAAQIRAEADKYRNKKFAETSAYLRFVMEKTKSMAPDEEKSQEK